MQSGFQKNSIPTESSFCRTRAGTALKGLSQRTGTVSTALAGSGDWLKLKCSSSERFAVIGYKRSVKVLGSIASPLLAARHGSELVYVGHVGRGFSAKLARDLQLQLDIRRIEKPPAPGIKGKRYVLCSRHWSRRSTMAPGPMALNCATHLSRGCVR